MIEFSQTMQDRVLQLLSHSHGFGLLNVWCVGSIGADLSQQKDYSCQTGDPTDTGKAGSSIWGLDCVRLLIFITLS